MRDGCFLFHPCSIHIVHDEVKDKSFELEMSWVGAGKSLPWYFFPQLVFKESFAGTLSDNTHK